MWGRLAFLVLAATAFIAPLHAKTSREQDGPPLAELIHSDLPLYDFSFEATWPRHFTDEDGSFGCTSRVAFGNWTFTDFDGETEAWQIANYGVFHCAAIFRQAPTRIDLDRSDYKYGLTVMLGTAVEDGKQVELWAFQKGMVPGSDYVLLARAPGGEIVKSFTVLQRTCNKFQLRRLEPRQTMDVWKTNYCAISSRAELLSLAKQMLARPPLGRLEWIEPLPADKSN